MLTKLYKDSADVKPPRIVVVGDIMLDRNVICEEAGFSPENTAVRKFNELCVDYMPGGATNVACNLSTLGARTVLFGVMGNDESGVHLRKALAGTNMSVMIEVNDGAVTTTKTRYMDGRGRHILRVDHEKHAFLSDSCLNSFEVSLQRLKAEDPPKLIVVSDYNKGVVTPDLLDMLRVLGCPIIVDPKGRDFKKYGPVYVITPNRAEAMLATVGSTDSPEFHLPCQAQWMVITRGDHGCMLCRSDSGLSTWKVDKYYQTHPRKFGDPTGCGDSFLAAVAYATAMGWPIETACKLGNAAGAVAVDFVGAHAVTRDELIRELENFDYEGVTT